MATIAEQVIANDPAFVRSPLAKYCVQNYLSEDALFNLVHFVPINVAVQNATAFKYSYTIENVDASSIDFRAIGGEYKKANNIADSADVALKILGGNFEVDEEFLYASTPGQGGLENYVDSQMRQKASELVKAFNKFTILGNATSDAKQFNGLEVLVPSSRTKSTPITCGDFSAEALRIARTNLYSVLDAVPGANLIITTIEGVSAFRALLATQNLSMSNSYVMTVASAANNTPGIPVINFEGRVVVGLPRAYFSAAELAIGEPFYVLRSDANKGFKFVTPAGRPPVVAKVPNLKDPQSTQHQGGVSMHTAPVIEDLYACAKGYISAGSADVTSLNNVTPRTAPEYTPATEDDSPSDSNLGGD